MKADAKFRIRKPHRDLIPAEAGWVTTEGGTINSRIFDQLRPKDILAVRQHVSGAYVLDIRIPNSADNKIREVIYTRRRETLLLAQPARKDISADRLRLGTKKSRRRTLALFEKRVREYETETRFFDWLPDDVVEVCYELNMVYGVASPIPIAEMEGANSLEEFARPYYVERLVDNLEGMKTHAAAEELRRVGLYQGKTKRITMPRRLLDNFCERIEAEFLRIKTEEGLNAEETYRALAGSSKTTFGMQMSARSIEGKHVRWKGRSGIRN